MKLRPHAAVLVLLGACVLTHAGIVRAQESPGQVQASPAAPPLSEAALDQLLSPIALYPDALIAQVLPASTYPLDIVRAARSVRAGATPADLDVQDLDPSVRAVAHYPTVLEMMDTSIQWTQQLGEAFMAQPADVLESIQRLRAQASAVGNLVNSDQQQVVLDGGTISILPVSPSVIYVPVYDPALVYFRRPAYLGQYVSFGVSFSIGRWLDLDFNWRDRSFYRPGWTWDHWRDNVVIERGRVVRRVVVVPRRKDRDRFEWHRDARKPEVLPGRRGARPGDFDKYRGRDGHDTPRTFSPPRPIETDRGRDRTPQPRQPEHAFDPRQPEQQTRDAQHRGEQSRASAPGRTGPARPQPTPRPAPAPKPTPRPASKPAPRPSPPQTAPRAPAGPPTPHPRSEPMPARVAPPPVKIAPPPPMGPARPPMTSGGPGSERGSKERGHR